MFEFLGKWLVGVGAIASFLFLIYVIVRTAIEHSLPWYVNWDEKLIGEIVKEKQKK